VGAVGRWSPEGSKGVEELWGGNRKKGWSNGGGRTGSQNPRINFGTDKTCSKSNDGQLLGATTNFGRRLRVKGGRTKEVKDTNTSKKRLTDIV